MYSLNSALNKVYYDNVSCSSVIIPGVFDGEYHFDTISQHINDKLVNSPTNSKDKVYAINGAETGNFAPDRYSTESVIYNFDFFHGSVNLSETVAGDRIYYVFNDADGRKITGIYLEVNEDDTISVYAANGQKLKLYGREEDMTLSH